jgi:hypothetical protein
LASSRQVKAFNLDLVKAVEDRTTVSVLEFIDGTRVSVMGSMATIIDQAVDNLMIKAGVTA